MENVIFGSTMEYTKYTVAVVLRCKDKLWMSQRMNTVNFPGKWQFPGGKLDHYENPFNGGLRELKEETNLNIEYERFEYLCSIIGDPSTKICFVYCVNLKETEIPVRTENKMTDWVLLTYDEALKKDLLPGLKNVIESLKNE